MSAVITREEFNRIKNIPMIFIMGKERSGTTLLQTFLDGHPNIVAPPESEFVLLLYPRFGKIKKWSEKNIHDFIEELYKEPWITKIWGIDRWYLTSLLLSVRVGADYSSICKVIYYCMRGEKENILLLSDKNPIYVLFANTILKIFPEAKFIHLIRDPRDNVSSHLKSFGATNTAFIAQKWLGYNTILKDNRLKDPQRYYTLLYESMVEDTETNMKKLCEFLNVSFNERMIHNTFSERLESFKNKKLILERTKEIHGNLLKPVNTSNIGKWKNQMSPRNIKIVERITGEFAAVFFNYAIDVSKKKSGISYGKLLKTKVLYAIWQFFIRMKYRSYWFNSIYTKINIYFGRETRVFGKALRES
jgi:hypothetical protein